jgi:hypothetical protein
MRNIECHHNYIIGPALGHQGTGAPADPVNRYHHHNIQLVHQMYIDNVAERMGHHAYAWHSGSHNVPEKSYHNLIITTQPVREPVGGHVFLPPYDQSAATRTNYSMNNIYMWYPRVPPGGSAPGGRWLARRWRANDNNYRVVHDGHGYWTILGPGVGGATALWNDVWSTGTSNAQDFASLAAWKASAKYTASIGRFGYADGIDTNSIQADPLLATGTAAMLDGDPRGKPASAWRPTAASYKTGAVNITGFGWPDASVYESWRGPSNPNGDWTDIGPQAAA